MVKLQRDDFVNVSIRIRPSQTQPCVQIINEQPPILFILERKQTYTFDNIYTEETDQQTIYNQTVAPLVDHVRAGYNCTVFAYGQTGTGKTYTIGTNPKIYDNNNDAGIISRALDDFFSSTTENDEGIEISISFIEIYNEKVYDLLSNNSDIPLIVKGFNVTGCLKCRIYDKYDALTYLENGCKKRHTGETKQNQYSSRSHAIFSIYYNENDIESKLNLVDLAGSENVKKTGNHGSSRQEGININKGLLSLGQVITALSSNSDHIPYRQSIITMILHDSLNKRNFVSLIACINSNIDDIGETCHTLDFATRVKRIKNKPEINQIISQYKNDNPDLFIKTPMKRSITTPIQDGTPFKRSKYLPKISELNEASISTCSSSTTILKENLSPLIKKHINAMENSLMDRLMNVLETTVERPRRKSSRLNNKLNSTPEFPLEKIRSIIRQEIVQFTSQSTRIRSPLVETDQIMGRKLFNSPSSSIPSTNQVSVNNNDNLIFQKPAPVKRLKIENIVRRRSVRVQSKSQDVENEPVVENCNRRKSVRLTLKNTQNSWLVLQQNDRVLNILNTGSVKDLQKLHTIGEKTAQTIIFFRQLNGGFQAISDLAKMPQWSQAKYERFCLQNFLAN